MDLRLLGSIQKRKSSFLISQREALPLPLSFSPFHSLLRCRRPSFIHLSRESALPPFPRSPSLSGTFKVSALGDRSTNATAFKRLPEARILRSYSRCIISEVALSLGTSLEIWLGREGGICMYGIRDGSADRAKREHR